MSWTKCSDCGPEGKVEILGRNWKGNDYTCNYCNHMDNHTDPDDVFFDDESCECESHPATYV